MAEHSRQDHAKVERAKNQAALTKLLRLRSAEIEGECDHDHSMAALAEAAHALKRIRRLAGLLDDAVAADEIIAKADALEATLNVFKVKSSPVSTRLALA
jgi:hypothetical protein